MRILFLNKTRYMNKHLLLDRYGRFYELPDELAARGHQVHGLTINYWEKAQTSESEHVSTHGARWDAVGMLPFPPVAVYRYLRLLKKIMANFKPQIIVACSDAYHAILAHHVARSHQVPFVVDLYDQFEAYAATRVPGVKQAYRNAVARADGISCVSTRLAEWANGLRAKREGAVVIGNAVSPDLFRPFNKWDCRRKFKLPDDGLLIGTAGSLTRSRDIETLYAAFRRISEQYDNAYLVVAGPRDMAPPPHERIIDLKQLPHAEVGELFSALDVGVVCNANSMFAHFCDPQKHLEMQACGLKTVLASSVGSGRAIQTSHAPGYLPGNADSLASALAIAIESPAYATCPPKAVPSWADQAGLLEGLLEEVRGMAENIR